MIEEIRGKKLLGAFRGAAARDVDALADALSRLSVFAAAHPETLDSIDINPLIVGEEGKGVVAADAVIIPLES